MNNSLESVIDAGSTGDGEGRELYALAVEKRLPNGQWIADEILHMHAFSEGNARTTFWQSLAPADHAHVRVTWCGRSVGGHALDANGDRIVI